MTREQFDQAQVLFDEISCWQTEIKRLESLKLCGEINVVIKGNRGTNSHEAMVRRTHEWIINFINNEIDHCETMIQDCELKIELL